MTKLPELPSDLIELALKDLKTVEGRPGTYRVDMEHFHTPRETEGVCLVCLAGAVIAETLEISPRTHVEVDALDEDTKKKLHALDNFREGDIDTGMELLGITNRDPSAIAHHCTAPYLVSPLRFKRDMQGLADDLRNEGL